MDKTKKIVLLLVLLLFKTSMIPVQAQDIAEFQLMDKSYEYKEGSDSISVFFNVLDSHGNRLNELSARDLRSYMVLREDGVIVPIDKCTISPVSAGRRIPANYTFSVLVDESIPDKGKAQIFDVLEGLVTSAPDSCVFLSFFGDVAKSTHLITRENYTAYRPFFLAPSQGKCLYSAIYAKLSEFEPVAAPLDQKVKKEIGYRYNELVSARAAKTPDRNALFVFTEGHNHPDIEELDFVDVSDYQIDTSNAVVPFVYAFYYTEDGNSSDISKLLDCLCTPRGIPERNGRYMPADNMAQVLSDFEHIVNEKSYDYEIKYQVPKNKTYFGKTEYQVDWKNSLFGTGSFSIGSPERPWPERPESAGDSALKYLVAILVTILVFVLVFFTMKILIPWVRSKSFERKYYRVYVPEENVRKRKCHYCGQEILPGQKIVIRCKHVMHVECWKQNNYRCAEYGQNCKDGIQPHVHFKELFTKAAMRESMQTLFGHIAALVAWLVFEVYGRGGFKWLSEWIVSFSLTPGLQESLVSDCVEKTSAFLMIGLLLGFFLALVFRYNDEYRTKNGIIICKIIGLSVLSGFVGLLAFGVGAIVLCALLSGVGTTFIPWYCSLPAYIFFSLSVAALLSWQSSIPIKSALVGGGIASLLGFFVLFFFSSTNGWVNILLDFIIYGGGLGASIITVRMLSERYFLVIQNGIRAGQRIPIHKWMNATGGGNKVSIGMTGECEIQMNWEKSNKVAKEHARLYIDQEKRLPVVKPLATGVIFNSRAELSVGKPYVLTNGDTVKVGDTIFKYVESE